MRLDTEWKKDVIAPPIEAWRGHLLGAAELIRTTGHTKFTIQDQHGLCTLGAISQMAVGDPWHSMLTRPPEAVTRFAQTLPVLAAEKMHGESLPDRVCEWNNMPERTKDEVIAALEACARMM